MGQGAQRQRHKGALCPADVRRAHTVAQPIHSSHAPAVTGVSDVTPRLARPASPATLGPLPAMAPTPLQPVAPSPRALPGAECPRHATLSTATNYPLRKMHCKHSDQVAAQPCPCHSLRVSVGTATPARGAGGTAVSPGSGGHALGTAATASPSSPGGEGSGGTDKLCLDRVLQCQQGHTESLTH